MQLVHMAYRDHHKDQPEDRLEDQLENRLEDPGEEKIGESNIINIIVITDNKMSYHGCHLQHSQLIKNSKLKLKAYKHLHRYNLVGLKLVTVL